MQALDNLFSSLFSNFINPVIYVFSAGCFVYFLYGVLMFILAKVNSKEEDIKRGKQHMIWGLVGVIIIFSAGSIYKFIVGLFN